MLIKKEVEDRILENLEVVEDNKLAGTNERQTEKLARYTKNLVELLKGQAGEFNSAERNIIVDNLLDISEIIDKGLSRIPKGLKSKELDILEMKLNQINKITK